MSDGATELVDAARLLVRTEPAWKPPWQHGYYCFYCAGPRDPNSPYKLRHRGDCSWKRLAEAVDGDHDG